ncbi:hypothetical protein [Methanoculleus taiwanensis]|uniref:hypothetical protein n=1 Tax=Methanoculleus taiwanensis TaxID=1550565 RepID=UPI0019D46143|nr:hypothetical protein [Methanoculleus taiwanensis]
MAPCSRHPDSETSLVCRICSEPCCEECSGIFGICTHCLYKISVVILVVMVIVSYSAWAFLL